MKRNITSGILLLSMALALAFISGSCSNSSNKEMESVDQEATAVDSPEQAGLNPQQQAPEPGMAAETSGKYAPEKEKAAENTANNRAITPPAAKETSTLKKVIKPSEISKTSSEPVIQLAKTETAGEPPQSAPVSPTKVAAGKEGTKIATPLQAKPDPALEKTKEVVVTQPPRPEPQVSGPPPGNWIVPEKDKNKKNPIKADAESLSIGKSLYNKHCASCHGKEGLGDGSKAAQLETPSGDFTLPIVQQQTDGGLFYKTREGRGDMPEYKKKIPDEEDIWHIVNYIRTFK